MFIKDETNKPFVPHKKVMMATSKFAKDPYGKV